MAKAAVWTKAQSLVLFRISKATKNQQKLKIYEKLLKMMEIFKLKSGSKK